MDNIKQKIIYAFRWEALQKWSGELLNLGILFILSRLLSPQDFGIVAIVNIFLIISRIFVDQGFSVILVQKSTIDDLHLCTAFWCSLILALAVIAITITSLEILVYLQYEIVTSSYIKAICYTLITSPFYCISLSILRRQLNFKPIFICYFTANLIGGTVAIFMAFNDYKAWSIVAKKMIEYIIIPLLLVYFTKWTPQWKFSRSCLDELFVQSKSILGIQFLRNCKRHVSDLLIGSFLGLQALGYYTIAQRFSLAIHSMLTMVMESVMLPAFSRVQDNREVMHSLFFQMLRACVVFIIPVYTLTILCADNIIIFFVGEQWSNSIPLLRIMCCIGAIHCLYKLNACVILSQRQEKFLFRVDLLHVLMIAGLFFLTKNWGIFVVVVANAILFFVMLLLSIHIMRRLDIKMKSYLKYIITFLSWQILPCVAVYVFFLNTTFLPFTNLVMGSVIFFGIYLCCMWLCKICVFLM